MINANYIINISESYVTSKKIDKDTSLEVYVNPTTSEIKKLTDASFKTFGVRQVRFVVDNKNKKVYVADAFLTLHHTILKLIGLNLSKEGPDYFTGIANVKGGKPEMLESNEWFNEWFKHSFYSNCYPNQYSRDLESLLSSDLRWLDQYIVCSSVIEKLKDKFRKAAYIMR
jgi:hypothetical protein